MSVVPESFGDPLRGQQILREIGVTEEVLITALTEGANAAAQCTPNHPPMAAGFYRFSETVRSLAEQQAPLGWTRHDYKNFSTVVRPDKRVAIAVASGNDGTGDLSADVSTRSPKGIATYEAVSSNLSLPLDERYEADNKAPVVQTKTWFLLHTRKDGRLCAELSLPKSIADGFVQTWEPRVPLQSFESDAATLDLLGGEPPHNPEVNVQKKRGN
jgi:hypothetical protein